MHVYVFYNVSLKENFFIESQFNDRYLDDRRLEFSCFEMESRMDEQEWNDSQSAWFIYLFCRWYLSGEMERTSVRYDCSIETQTNAKETWKNGWWWNTLNSMISFPGRITRRISPQFSSRERSITRARYIASRGPRMASWWRPEATTKLSNWCASTPTHQISKVNLSIQRER